MHDPQELGSPLLSNLEASFDVVASLSDADRARLQEQEAGDRRRTISWLRAESLRRQSLNPSGFCRTYLVSFPRSGNHAVRYAIESLSRRPTLGANDHERLVPPRGLHDLPLFLRDPLLNVLAADPVLVKRHWLRPFDVVDRLVYLRRDPAEAILSHTRGKDANLQSLAEAWHSLQVAFQRHPADSRIDVEFSELMGSDWLMRLADFLGLDVLRSDVIEVSANLMRAKNVLRRRPQTVAETTWAERFPRGAEKIEDILSALDAGVPPLSRQDQ
jgi:hypothetical protein